MKITELCLLTICVLGLSGCSVADLRSAQLRKTGLDAAQVERGRILLQQATWKRDVSSQWDRFDTWTVTARDVWYSGLIRRFTPLTLNDQLIEFVFELKRDEARMTLLDGDEAGTSWITRGDQGYTSDGEDATSARLMGYLPPIRDYFFWPQSLVNASVITYQGEDELDGELYHKIFVTNGNFEVSKTEDQYIVWISQRDLSIDFVEFTLRSLLKSYRGVVEYRDYREVQGIQLAHNIKLTDSVGSTKYSHEFFVEEYQFFRDETPLTLEFQKIRIEDYL